MTGAAGVAMEALILDLAGLIDSDATQALDWYRSVPIAELGGRTAAELVTQGQGRQVLGFLVRVVSSRQD